MEEKGNNRVQLPPPTTPAASQLGGQAVPVSVKPIVTPQMEMLSGVLEIMQDGAGFVRPKFLPNHHDAVIGAMQVRRYGLRPEIIFWEWRKRLKTGKNIGEW